MTLTQEMADSLSWFHGMRLDCVTTRGRLNPENWSLYPMLRFMESMDFRGARTLDIGTMDGLVAFIMELEGAAEVHATDLYERQTMTLARDRLGLGTRYHPKTSIEDLIDRFGRSSFDVLVMGGLLYHLLSPLRGVLIARHLLRTRGLLLLETVCVDGELPVLHFNPADPVIDEYTTYFVPTVSAVTEMLRFSLFDVLRIGSIRPVGDKHRFARCTFLACAHGLDAANPSTPLMAKSIRRASRSRSDAIMDELNFAHLEGTTNSAMPTPERREGVESFDARDFSTRFALQP